MMNKKDLNYYLDLDYPIEISKIPEYEGGGWYACIPQLGRDVFIGDGETQEEALLNLERVKKEWFEIYLEKNIDIKEPIKETDDEYSGKFVVRIPKKLHCDLAINAKKNKVSLNHYTSFLLSQNYVYDNFASNFDKIYQKLDTLIDIYSLMNVKYTILNKELNERKKQNDTLNLKPNYAKSA